LDLNNAIQKFPTNVVAHYFKFQTKEFFEVESGKVREVPQVKIYEGED
jgi:LemA protein